jgi:hypothetical protein
MLVIKSLHVAQQASVRTINIEMSVAKYGISYIGLYRKPYSHSLP